VAWQLEQLVVHSMALWIKTERFLVERSWALVQSLWAKERWQGPSMELDRAPQQVPLLALTLVVL
jgi:hypothetical protein